MCAAVSDGSPLTGSKTVSFVFLGSTGRDKPIKCFAGLRVQSSFINDEHGESEHWSFTGVCSVIRTSINDHKVPLL